MWEIEAGGKKGSDIDHTEISNGKIPIVHTNNQTIHNKCGISSLRSSCATSAWSLSHRPVTFCSICRSFRFVCPCGLIFPRSTKALSSSIDLWRWHFSCPQIYFPVCCFCDIDTYLFSCSICTLFSCVSHIVFLILAHQLIFVRMIVIWCRFFALRLLCFSFRISMRYRFHLSACIR